MHDYEVLLMLDPELSDNRQEEIVVRTRQLVEQGGGTWIGHDPWGRRRLAYEIDKKTDGIYHLVQFDAEPETLDELTRILKITDGVMRHMPTRRVKGAHGPGRPGPEPVLESSAGRSPEYTGANVRSTEAPAPAASGPEETSPEAPVGETPETEGQSPEGQSPEEPGPDETSPAETGSEETGSAEPTSAEPSSDEPAPEEEE